MAAPARALLIDMDGVLYQGEQAIPGAREVLEWIDSNAIPHLFLTKAISVKSHTILLVLSSVFGVAATVA